MLWVMRLVDDFPRRGNCNYGMLLFNRHWEKRCNGKVRGAGLRIVVFGIVTPCLVSGPADPSLWCALEKVLVCILSIPLPSIWLVCGGTMVQGAGGDSVMWSGGGGKRCISNVAI